jgi:hypothetical protein
VIITAGATYKFKVEARNSVGYSLQSQELSVLAAQPPDKPAAPITSFSGLSVVVTWLPPYNGGTPIISYKVLFKYGDGVTYD